MAHPINDLFDRIEGKKAKLCDSGCKNYKFDHLETACVLSEVFSVPKGKPCYIYDEEETNGKGK